MSEFWVGFGCGCVAMTAAFVVTVMGWLRQGRLVYRPDRRDGDA